MALTASQIVSFDRSALDESPSLAIARLTCGWKIASTP
jgi:hypothetical protein